MKLNYGAFIIALYGGFVLLMGVLVYKCTSMKVDVINKDYYAEEIAYQQQIEKQDRTHNLTQQPTWNVNGDNVTIQFPKLESTEPVKGTAEFYCPSDDTKDKTFPITVNSENVYTVAKSTLKAGRYKMKLNWTVGSKAYYNEGFVRIDS
jgi:hypothetical protein